MGRVVKQKIKGVERGGTLKISKECRKRSGNKMKASRGGKKRRVQKGERHQGKIKMVLKSNDDTIITGFRGERLDAEKI